MALPNGTRLAQLRYLMQFSGYCLPAAALVHLIAVGTYLIPAAFRGNWVPLAAIVVADTGLVWLFLLSTPARQGFRAAARQMDRYRELMAFICSHVPLGKIGYFAVPGPESCMMIVSHSRDRNRMAEVVRVDGRTLRQLEALANGDSTEEIITRRVMLLNRQLPTIHGQVNGGKVRLDNHGEGRFVMDTPAPRSSWKSFKSRYSAVANGTAYADGWEIDMFLEGLRAGQLIGMSHAVSYGSQRSHRDT